MLHLWWNFQTFPVFSQGPTPINPGLCQTSTSKHTHNLLNATKGSLPQGPPLFQECNPRQAYTLYTNFIHKTNSPDNQEVIMPLCVWPRRQWPGYKCNFCFLWCKCHLGVFLLNNSHFKALSEPCLAGLIQQFWFNLLCNLTYLIYLLSGSHWISLLVPKLTVN